MSAPAITIGLGSIVRSSRAMNTPATPEAMKSTAVAADMPETEKPRVRFNADRYTESP